MRNKEQTIAALPAMNISGIAAVVRSDWQPVGFAAKPYLDAMLTMDKVTDPYGADPGTHIVNYFLGNAQTWRGEVARAVKTELKSRLKAAK
jgi:hypothetical protein